MNLAVVGCGFVADFYLKTLANYPHLKVLGVMDQERDRADRFAKYYNLTVYDTLEKVTRDERVQIVLNLTNPRSHYIVTRACLMAGKHVYSEKPLATQYAQAEELVQLAVERNVQLSGAPCGVLGEAAQTAWHALRHNAIGTVRLVYAELDDGMIHRMNYRAWNSDSGSPWPWKDEFEVGCTLEHAGYYVTWLVAFFGPAKRVTSFASVRISDKSTDVPIMAMAPDFATASIEFASGVVARVTCSVIAPHDHQLRIFGDEGALSVPECWHYESPVFVKRHTRLGRLADRYPLLSAVPGIGPARYPRKSGPPWRHRYRGTHQHDFARGVAELAAAINEGRQSRLSVSFALHVNEIVLAMQHPDIMGSPRVLTSTCEQMEPMPWARNG
jgi:predicted dehydrogenase